MSLTLTDDQLNERFENFAVLAGRPRQLEDLSGGLTNRNIKITTPDGVYVARCTDTSSNLLGIDRERECHNSRAAEQAGVGAPVIDYRPDLGILLLGDLEGKTLCMADLQRPAVLTQAPAPVRALHHGTRVVGRFGMFARQPAHLMTVVGRGFRIPADSTARAGCFVDVAGVRKATVQSA